MTSPVISLAVGLLKGVLAIRGGHAQLRCVEVRPVFQCLCLKILDRPLHRLISEGSGHIIVQPTDRTEQLAQIREPLRAGKLCRRDIGLELKELKLDLKVVVFADITCLIARSAMSTVFSKSADPGSPMPAWIRRVLH